MRTLSLQSLLLPVSQFPPMASQREKTLQGKYELGRLLGRGAFAKVYLAREISTSKSAAIKCISKQNILDHGLSANVSREISILRRLRHPHIVSLTEVLASKSTIYFVMELAKGGELFSKLAAGRLSEDLSRRIFHQLISAVGYCHTRGVFHRDLKPENLLLDENGDLKVTDFGLSAVSEQAYKNDLLRTRCGTPAYVPPEILSKAGYSGAKADLWSCGIILFVLAAGYLPFNDANLMTMYRKIIRGEFRFPRWFSPELKLLVSRLLDTNPKSRITVEEISRDAWFRKGLNVERWKELTFFGNGGTAEEKMGKWEEREVNAFDIISLSSGLDLSGLLGAVEGKERVVVREEGVAVEMIEKMGKREKLEVRRWGERGSRMTIEGGGRRLIAMVDVRRISEEILMVEVEKGRDFSPDFDGFWEKKMMPFLESLRRGGSSPSVGL